MNIEKHRGYIQTHRFDADYSERYAALENVFIKVAEGKDQGSMTETIYRMDTVQKTLLNTFLEGRNNALLFSKGNVDENGKATIVDPQTNRPIYISDGLIPQVEAFASKYAYNKLTINVLRTAIQTLNEKARNATGNHYMFICNEAFYYQLGDLLDTYLAQYHTDGTYLWSMKANGYVEVGARGFDTYRWMGNDITFKVDRTFSREFGLTFYRPFVTKVTSKILLIAGNSLQKKDNQQLSSNSVSQGDELEKVQRLSRKGVN